MSAAKARQLTSSLSRHRRATEGREVVFEEAEMPSEVCKGKRIASQRDKEGHRCGV